jgi:hypothetical protein
MPCEEDKSLTFFLPRLSMNTKDATFPGKFARAKKNVGMNSLLSCSHMRGRGMSTASLGEVSLVASLRTYLIPMRTKIVLIQVFSP